MKVFCLENRIPLSYERNYNEHYIAVGTDTIVHMSQILNADIQGVFSDGVVQNELREATKYKPQTVASQIINLLLQKPN